MIHKDCNGHIVSQLQVWLSVRAGTSAHYHLSVQVDGE